MYFYSTCYCILNDFSKSCGQAWETYALGYVQMGSCFLSIGLDIATFTQLWKFAKRRKEIKNVGQARRDGEAWLVPFVVHDGGNGESYDVTGRVTSVNGAMRLTSVANMESLLRKVAAESREVQP